MSIVKRNKNVGDQLNELVKLKEKAKRESNKRKEDFIYEAAKNCDAVSRSLLKEIDKFKGKSIDELEFANNIYKILVENSFKNLSDAKEEYDFWKDLNDKFNS